MIPKLKELYEQAISDFRSDNNEINTKINLILKTVSELGKEGIKVLKIDTDDSDALPVIRIDRPSQRILDLGYTRFRNRFNHPLAHVFDHGCIIEWVQR